MILVVDDDPMVVRAITAALATEGYQVMVAQSGAAGLEIFLADPDAIDLVLSDVIMPFLNGIEMAKQITAARPGAPIVLMSGYSDAVITTLNEPRYPLIRKPFLTEDLIRVVQANITPPAAHA
jgi:two-component system, cell cycle sensor histidine kinase and response regulator CckA